MSETEQNNDMFDKLVALSTSFIAVGLSISTILNNAAGDDLLIFRSEANNKWSYFQSKSIKQSLYDLEAKNLELSMEDESLSPKYRDKTAERVLFFKKESKRYEVEKGEISADAKQAEDLMEKADQKGTKFDLAEALYQIAIILSAISMIAKSRPTWYLSILLGVIAIGITTYTHFFMP